MSGGPPPKRGRVTSEKRRGPRTAHAYTASSAATMCEKSSSASGSGSARRSSPRSVVATRSAPSAVYATVSSATKRRCGSDAGRSAAEAHFRAAQNARIAVYSPAAKFLWKCALYSGVSVADLKALHLVEVAASTRSRNAASIAMHHGMVFEPSERARML